MLDCSIVGILALANIVRYSILNTPAQTHRLGPYLACTVFSMLTRKHMPIVSVLKHTNTRECALTPKSALVCTTRGSISSNTFSCPYTQSQHPAWQLKKIKDIYSIDAWASFIRAFYTSDLDMRSTHGDEACGRHGRQANRAVVGAPLCLPLRFLLLVAILSLLPARKARRYALLALATCSGRIAS